MIGWSSSDTATVGVVDPTAFFTACFAVGVCLPNISYSRNGFVGGVQGGYNWQIDQFVLGVEGDIDYSGMSGDSSEKEHTPEIGPKEETPKEEAGTPK